MEREREKERCNRTVRERWAKKRDWVGLNKRVGERERDGDRGWDMLPWQHWRA